jgi:hypothetical protein
MIEGKITISFESVPDLCRQLMATLNDVGAVSVGSPHSFSQTVTQAAPKEEAKAEPKEEAKAEPKEEAKAEPKEEAKAEPKVTLENLSTVPYGELLAFCDANPDIGVNSQKCVQEFFRGYVETRIRTYLE